MTGGERLFQRFLQEKQQYESEQSPIVQRLTEIVPVKFDWRLDGRMDDYQNNQIYNVFPFYDVEKPLPANLADMILSYCTHAAYKNANFLDNFKFSFWYHDRVHDLDVICSKRSINGTDQLFSHRTLQVCNVSKDMTLEDLLEDERGSKLISYLILGAV